MLPCVLAFDDVMREGGYSRFLAEWGSAERAELLVDLRQLECEETLRITEETLALDHPSTDDLARETRQWLEDGDDLKEALWNYVSDHREELGL